MSEREDALYFALRDLRVQYGGVLRSLAAERAARRQLAEASRPFSPTLAPDGRWYSQGDMNALDDALAASDALDSERTP